MGELGIIIVIIILFLVFLLSGMYIHTVLLAASIIGLIWLQGFDILTGLLGPQPFNRTAAYTLTTIPLFVLMAQFILQADIVKDLFYMINKISGGRKSFLGMLTIVAGGLLGAVSGSGTATAASLGQVAVPELNKHGYRPELSGAVAAAAGSLSGIIPPSIILILYGVATETPIGDLFIAAIIPGILVTLVFIGVMLFFLSFKKNNIDTSELRKNQKEMKVPVSRLIIVNVVAITIVTVIFGGIYSGMVTPTEAGAIGALAAFISALVLGKVNLNFMKKSLLETVSVTVMVFLILIGAQIFGRFVSLSMLPRKLISMLEPIMEYPILILILLSIVFFILFMFLEGAAVILMSIPVVLPIIEAINVDIIWFGIFITVIATVGLITPPVGLSVYAVSGTTRISSDGIFNYGIVFALAAAVVVCGLLITFPELATWLPNSM